jgi:hypothetical protein
MHSFFNFALKRGWPLPVKIAASSLIMDPINISVAMMLNNVNKGLCGGQSLVDSFQLAIQKVCDTTNVW